MDGMNVVDRWGRRLKGLAFIALFATALQSPAWADPLLLFDIDPSAGDSLFYGGTGGPLVGSNILVDTVLGIDTPLNNFVGRNCVGCFLNFTTGNFAFSTPGPSGSWFWGPGGLASITVTGGVDLDNDGGFSAGDIPAGTMLLTGTLAGARVFDLDPTDSIGELAAGLFLDTKHPDLLDFWGLPGGLYEGELAIEFEFPFIGIIDLDPFIDPPAAFITGDIAPGPESTDISVIANTPIPEPTTMLLLGSGLIGLVGARLRRSRSR